LSLRVLADDSAALLELNRGSWPDAANINTSFKKSSTLFSDTDQLFPFLVFPAAAYFGTLERLLVSSSHIPQAMEST
jgi:hypothetical protein